MCCSHPQGWLHPQIGGLLIFSATDGLLAHAAINHTATALAVLRFDALGVVMLCCSLALTGACVLSPLGCIATGRW